MLEAIVVGLLILSALVYGCWQVGGGAGSAETESKLPIQSYSIVIFEVEPRVSGPMRYFLTRL